MSRCPTVGRVAQLAKIRAVVPLIENPEKIHRFPLVAAFPHSRLTSIQALSPSLHDSPSRDCRVDSKSSAWPGNHAPVQSSHILSPKQFVPTAFRPLTQPARLALSTCSREGRPAQKPRKNPMIPTHCVLIVARISEACSTFTSTFQNPRVNPMIPSHCATEIRESESIDTWLPIGTADRLGLRTNLNDLFQGLIGPAYKNCWPLEPGRRRFWGQSPWFGPTRKPRKKP